MQRKINCGSFWTVLSTECWLKANCDGCTYCKYCYRRGKHGINAKPIIKMVVDQLLVKFGEPPQKMITNAINNLKNPIILKVEKKSELRYYKLMGDLKCQLPTL